MIYRVISGHDPRWLVSRTSGWMGPKRAKRISDPGNRASRDTNAFMQDFCFRFEDRRINCLTIVPHQDERQSSLASHGSMVLRLVIPDWMAGLVVRTCIRSRCAEQ